MFIKTIIFLLFINYVSPYYLFPQSWIFNQSTKYLSNKIVYDIEVINDSTWILANNGLIRLHDNDIKKYEINHKSFGELKKYETSNDSYVNNFTHLTKDNNMLWLISIDHKTVLNIEQGIINNYKINFRNDKDLIFLNSFSYNKELWLFCSYYDSIKYKEIIFYFYGNEFNTYHPNFLPRILELNDLVTFFIYNGIKFFIYKKNQQTLSDGNYTIFLSPLDSNSYILFNNSSQFYKYYCDSNSVYLMNSTTDFLKLPFQNNEKIIFTKLFSGYLPINFEFIVFDNLVYITSLSGLLVYDFATDHLDTLKPPDFNKKCLLGFDKLALNNNELWLAYGNGLKYNCYAKNFGIAILKMK